MRDTDLPAEEFWESFYAARERVWSGRPNVALVDVVGPLTPGTALDLGCAEGADSVWLAAHGWTVTGVDLSATALARAATHAAEAGVALDLQVHDLAQSFPDGRFDLVSACFLQSPVEFPRTRVLRRAAGAVAPGGLLLVEHGSAPSWSWAPPDLVFPTPEQALAELDLDPAEWTTERLGAPEREATGPNGETGVLTDIVLALRRRAG
ncbi:class I SAM-dependent methyltransferase [Modestobacter marinus]|uniref:Methyltransferase n=1 Tax=Modestobacter marinus TaxID=477641 RepID=A0A846LL31_9ACTN|nr:class I SAM-dependent methyltransferase [Modestobacter marinus]NIH68197.1 SAM-dependent methyltransferase [Modestobacter marinus]GGL79549.1 methyltransferase [Modestobacter marinus]